jgi:hypothetical protein
LKFNTYRQGRLVAGAIDDEEFNKTSTKFHDLKNSPDEKGVEKARKTVIWDESRHSGRDRLGWLG